MTEDTLTSSNVLFGPTNTPKSENIQFLSSRKTKIFTFEKLKDEDFIHL